MNRNQWRLSVSPCQTRPRAYQRSDRHPLSTRYCNGVDHLKSIGRAGFYVALVACCFGRGVQVQPTGKSHEAAGSLPRSPQICGPYRHFPPIDAYQIVPIHLRRTARSYVLLQHAQHRCNLQSPGNTAHSGCSSLARHRCIL